jgi:uncharacterized protein (TIGR02266 family)
VDVELSRAETELQAEEAALHAELSRLAQVSSELTQRLATLRSQASQAGDAAIAQRAQISPPVIDPNAGFSRVRAAREAAVKARREVNAAVRTQVAGVKGQLQKLAQQVVADEKAIVAVQDRARAAPPQPVAATVRSPAPPAAAPPSAAKPQRTSPRVKMQAAVDFTSDNNFFNGFSANISDGGLFVATVNLLPLGTEVDLSFSLPSGDRIEAKGVVQWVREVNDQLPDVFPGMGVQFAALNPAAQSAITQFLVQRDPLFFADAE